MCWQKKLCFSFVNYTLPLSTQKCSASLPLCLLPDVMQSCPPCWSGPRQCQRSPSTTRIMLGLKPIYLLTLLSIVMIAWPSLSLMLSSNTTFTLYSSQIWIIAYFHTLKLSSSATLKSIILKSTKPKSNTLAAKSLNEIHQNVPAPTNLLTPTTPPFPIPKLQE